MWSTWEEFLAVWIDTPGSCLIDKVARANIAVGAEQVVLDLGHLYILVLFLLTPVAYMR